MLSVIVVDTPNNLGKVLNMSRANYIAYEQDLNSIVVQFASSDKEILIPDYCIGDCNPIKFLEAIMDKIWSTVETSILIDLEEVRQEVSSEY